MNLQPEEQILIKDIFAATVDPAQSGLFYLRDFSQEVAGFGCIPSSPRKCIPDTTLDLLRLAADGATSGTVHAPAFSQTEILAYLEDSWGRAEEAKDKPWNTSPQAR